MGKLFITDERMLELMGWAIGREGLPATQNAYLTTIGVHRQNITNIRIGNRGFTVEQLLKAAELTGANLNWIFGLEDNMFREDLSARKSDDLIAQLRKAVTAIERELQTKTKR